MVLVVLAAGGVKADTMVVAGKRMEAPVRCAVVGEEVYAPLLPALKALGARFELGADSIRITTAAGREIVISRTRPEATRDGVLRVLPGLPQARGGAVLLPARAVGSLLGCSVRWDEGKRALFLHPWVRTFRLEVLPDRYRVTVGGEAPLVYRTGRLEGPPRLYVDLVNVDLADIPSEARVEGSYLRGARVSQNSIAPAPEGDVVRVVMELSEWRPYRVQTSADRLKVEIDFPLPDASELPAEAPPVVLSGVGFKRMSPRLAAVTLEVFGSPLFTSGSQAKPPAVWVDVANAENRVRGPMLEVRDSLVSGVSVGPAPEQPGAQRVTVALREPVGHAVERGRGELRLLLGRVDLAEVSVVIDAGHGGHDTGAVGRSGLREKEVNLDIALRTGRLLEEMGAKVRLTRSDDYPVIPWRRGSREEHRAELLARCAVADDMGADLFVSVHANARERNPHAVRGTETYYRKDDSRAFAEVMQEEVVRAVGLPDGGTKYHPKPIIVLYGTSMPAVLVEVAYLSHPEDERELATTKLRERAAQGIANGVKRWVSEGGVLSRMAVSEGKPEAGEARDAGGEGAKEAEGEDEKRPESDTKGGVWRWRG